EPKKKPEPPPEEIEALINRLTELDQQDTGYSWSVTGSAFLPLGRNEMHTGLFDQKPHEPSGALRSLVKLGTKALPPLLAHLNHDRPTKITHTHDGFFGGMFVGEDEGEKKKEDDPDFGAGRKQYTVMVGDLCYVAIGQIVNRNYWAVRYQPTAIIFVT